MDRPHSPVGRLDRGRVRARRDVLLALWAARRMGLSAARMEDYAATLAADAEPEDVLARVSADLAAAGRPVPLEALRRQLHELELQAVSQLTAEAGVASRRRPSGARQGLPPSPAHRGHPCQS